MSLSRRLFRTFSTPVAIATLAAGAQPALGQPPIRGDAIVFSIPQFVVTAVKFKALDETGWDRWGSDEVHAVFADFNRPDERVTSVYEDVDSGETKNFRSADTCIAPQPYCDQGRSNLHFGVALWERDKPSFPFSGSDFCYGSLDNTIDFYYQGICSGDDLIGRYEVTLSQADLVAALPTVGATADYTVTPAGGAGSYRFTYRITRLANTERTIVIHLPPIPLPPISLQASVSPIAGGSAVTLNWSGATATNVDIYRNAALTTTTPNDGQYVEARPSGTYEYFVCNAGSATFCSGLVSVVVP